MKLKPPIALLSCWLLTAPGLALAQTPNAPVVAPGLSNCAPTQSTAAGTVAPTGNSAERAEPLADKLAKSDGVLCPPTGVDPAIRAPTPDTGNTPVLPPPGSPGGDPSVRPK